MSARGRRFRPGADTRMLNTDLLTLRTKKSGSRLAHRWLARSGLLASVPRTCG